MHPRKLGDIIVLRSLKKEIGLPEIQQYLDSEEPYVWSSAITALGHAGGRPAYDIWLRLLEHENMKVIERAILAAGDLKDSRCIFPLANIYLNNKDSQLRFATINALAKLGDPRGIELLPVLLEQEQNADLKGAIDNCIKAQDYSGDFFYTFNGPEEKRLKAMETDFRILVEKPQDLDKLLDIWAQLKRRKIARTPETYIIDKAGRLYIGGYIEEHVKVAQGKDLLAAGEMQLKKEKEWTVTHINNRSYGYYPAANSYSIIKPVLEKIDIKHPEEFTEIYPIGGYFSEESLSLQPLHPRQKKKKRKKLPDCTS
jgi:hypothetical protein